MEGTYLKKYKKKLFLRKNMMYKKQIEEIKNYFSKFSNIYSLSIGLNFYQVYNREDLNNDFRDSFNFYKNNYEDSFYFEIDIADERKNLSFFSNFTIKKTNLINKFSLITKYHKELEEIKNYLDYYFQYRDIILDIERISSDDFEKVVSRGARKRTSTFIEEIVDNLQSNNIVIEKFPIINKKTAEEYFQKIKKLIELYLKFLNLESKFFQNGFYVEFSQETLFPFLFRINGYKDDITMSLHLIGIPFFHFLNILDATIDNLLTLQFFISLLFHYNLQDKLYIELQKTILNKIEI